MTVTTPKRSIFTNGLIETSLEEKLVAANNPFELKPTSKAVEVIDVVFKK